ncbi:MAG TPA: alpha/beta fold hydrolase [Candidatus Limnocylindrales bacterium]|nr:alpha/beta fold hydrolase [Candidatus Limnocylindrales bacterium]
MSDAFEGRIPVPGGELWAQWAGSGSGVLLIHAGIADARMWDPQWDALAARHRVARYDTRGFGRTETEEVPFSNRADAIAVLDAAGIDRAVVVGSSRGGAIALDTALEFPDRIAGVAWVCGGIGGFDMEDEPEIAALFERQEALYEAKDWEAVADLDVAIWIDGVGQAEGRAPAAVRDLVRRMCLETYVQEKPEGEPIQLEPRAIERLESLTVPVLAIVGLLDLPATAIQAGVLQERAPGTRRIDLPDVSHLPNLERPEWFNETLLAFLDEVDGRGR